jgi:hypothetical protein
MADENDRDVLVIVCVTNQRAKGATIHIVQCQVAKDQVEAVLFMHFDHNGATRGRVELKFSPLQQVGISSQKSI